MSNDNTNDQPIRVLEAEGPGVPLSDLLVDIEPRAINTNNDACNCAKLDMPEAEFIRFIIHVQSAPAMYQHMPTVVTKDFVSRMYYSFPNHDKHTDKKRNEEAKVLISSMSKST
ncbi:hypothetical protein O0I10_001633, partial [Lichtheimia ornata]